MFKLTDEQFQQLAALETTNSPTKYAEIYDLIDGWLGSPDPFGFAAPGNLQAWFGAAAQANRGEGAASDFIRTYTEEQLEIRSGGNIANVDTLLQGASNAIAAAVLEDISITEEPIDGEIFYTIPSLAQIGDQDASQTLAALPDFSNPAIWSGNLLFIGLGDGSFWAETALESSGDTYDIVVAARSAVSAGLGTLFSGGFSDLVTLFASQSTDSILDAAEAAEAAFNATNAFWEDAYGFYSGGGVSGLALTDIASGLTAGSDGDDAAQPLVQQGLTDSIFIHGGAGNDFIIGSRGVGIIDGGAGFDDSVSFESDNDGSVTASLSLLDSTARFSAAVTGSGIDIGIFNAEGLTLTQEDDVLVIDTPTLSNSSLNEVNAAGHSSHGDTVSLDGDFVTQAAQVNLESGTLSFGEGSSLSIVGFENIIGSKYRDTLTGDDSENIIDGGDLRDIISGLGGNDRLFGGGGNDVLIGGDGDDILEGQQGRDFVQGGFGDDLLFASQFFENASDEISSQSQLRGEKGDDVLVADAGGNTLGGGADNDILIGGDGDDVLLGGNQSDLIIARGGTDEVNGGRGDDWIKAMDDQGSAIVYFDKNGGNDFIEGDGVSEIRFEGLNVADVELIWDYEYSNDYDDSGDDYGEPDLDYFEFYEGEAIIRVKETGASINIGNLLGTGRKIDFTDPPDEGVPLFSDDFSAELQDGPDLVFEDIEITQSSEEKLIEYLQISIFGSGPPVIIDGQPYIDTTTIFSFQNFGYDANDVFEDTGAMALEDIEQGLLSDYDNAKDKFASEFSNSFTDLPAELLGEIQLTDVLNTGAIQTLTTDVFDFA